MTTFTKLELAALKSIISERPELAPELERQLSLASVVERKNTGAGFFTTLLVPPENASLESEPLVGETHARIPGLEHGLGFVLFFESGRMHTLEGFTYGSESTVSFDLASLAFEIVRIPVNRVS